MEENHLRLLVKRYLNKKSTDEELEVFVSLMKSGKLDKYIQEAMDNDINPECPAAINTGYPTEIKIDHPKQKRNRFMLLRWPVAAALICALSMMIYFSIDRQPANTQAKSRQIKINNLTGLITKTMLPDGSAVWLNPNATLSYPSKFGKTRDVTMRGEAFFEVTKDPAHPFIVNSGNVLTKVWGTSFRIRAINGENNTQVSVLTGKVSVVAPVLQQAISTHKAVSAGKVNGLKEIILHPDEEATYRPETHSLLKARIKDRSDLMIWRKTNLSFDNATLDSITTALSQYYHVPVKLENKVIAKLRLTADFNDKNMADILTLICRSLHTTYTRENNTIILRTTIQ